VQGLLGLKDHHTAQIVIGSQLSQLDRRICYADKGKAQSPPRGELASLSASFGCDGN
jgi:hypothetical protein